MKKAELLAPAGDMECLKTAVRYGADAVYVGGTLLQLRTESTAFGEEALRDASLFLHAHGKRLYVTVNSFAKNEEIGLLANYAALLCDVGADAAIVSDLGVLRTLKEAKPELSVHISTQANCCNYAAARTYFDLGASRIVLAREMSIAEIAALRSETPPELELEAFVHGAMCMAYSGRCLISSFLNHRSGNRGECTQPCRWNYALVEQNRPNEFFSVEEEGTHSAILSSHDLKAISFLPELQKAGVCSFKIEGRRKTAYYVAHTVGAYRHAIDGDVPLSLLERELNAVSHRPYSSGFYYGEEVEHSLNDGQYHADCTFAGVALEPSENGFLKLMQRNFFRVGDLLEVVSPKMVGLSFRVEHIVNEDNEEAETACHPQEILRVNCPVPVETGDILRVRHKDDEENG